MQVIMLKTGELKQVADGYARNYLFPRKLAVAATSAAQKQAEAIRAKAAAEQQASAAAQAVLAERLAGQTVTITAKANESGKLFAALRATDITVALAKVDFTIVPDNLDFTPIKQTGDHKVKVQFPGQAAVTITVNVMAE